VKSKSDLQETKCTQSALKTGQKTPLQSSNLYI